MLNGPGTAYPIRAPGFIYGFWWGWCCSPI